jgi:hypothetical protein
MALPRLWEKVTLRSYSDLRYVNGRPEGYGSGAPFSMGLGALVVGNQSGYVRSLRFVGEFRDADADEYTKGRVPASAMMLNISVRAALDRLEKLDTF